VEAPAQGEERESPEEVENPGEHRAPSGLNRHLEATDSQGEKGPEDEPLSLTCRMTLSATRAERELGVREGRGTNQSE
jgi:hypothetical protein